MKKKIMITVASLAALGAAVAGYLHFSGRTPFGHSCGMLCSYTSTKGVRK